MIGLFPRSVCNGNPMLKVLISTVGLKESRQAMLILEKVLGIK